MTLLHLQHTLRVHILPTLPLKHSPNSLTSVAYSTETVSKSSSVFKTGAVAGRTPWSESPAESASFMVGVKGRGSKPGLFSFKGSMVSDPENAS